jgi:hypothetical protein
LELVIYLAGSVGQFGSFTELVAIYLAGSVGQAGSFTEQGLGWRRQGWLHVVMVVVMECRFRKPEQLFDQGIDAATEPVHACIRKAG